MGRLIAFLSTFHPHMNRHTNIRSFPNSICWIIIVKILALKCVFSALSFPPFQFSSNYSSQRRREKTQLTWQRRELSILTRKSVKFYLEGSLKASGLIIQSSLISIFMLIGKIITSMYEWCTLVVFRLNLTNFMFLFFFYVYLGDFFFFPRFSLKRRHKKTKWTQEKEARMNWNFY